MKIYYAIKRKIRVWSEEGIRFPMAHDITTGKPSVTLLFPYISFFIAMTAIILLMRENTLYGAIAAIGSWIIALVLYLMRKLTKAKIDIDDKSIELENEESDEPKVKENS